MRYERCKIVFIYVSLVCKRKENVLLNMFCLLNFVNWLVDINECLEDNSVCQGGDCINTEGSYDCTCPDGFQLNDNKGCQGTSLSIF